MDINDEMVTRMLSVLNSHNPDANTRQAVFEALVAVLQDSMEVGPTDFEVWWAAYGYKVAKPAAKRAYNAARRRGHSRDALLHYAQDYAKSRGESFWLNPATFLNGERWADQKAPRANTVAGSLLDLANMMDEADARTGHDPQIGHDVRRIPSHPFKR